MINKNYTYLLSLVIKDLSLLFFTEDLSMDGSAKTSTLDVTREVPPYPCSRLKMETASEGIPALSGHLYVHTLVILLPSSSTSHNRGISHILNK